MISFRFHLVSLVAVFLALGVGVITGTTVINQGLVERLQRETDELSADLDALRADFGVWTEFGEASRGPLVTGRLAEQEVILVTQDGTSEESLTGVRGALEDGGASVVALLSVGPRMALSTEADREALATILGMEPTDDPGVLASEAARSVAERLAEGPNGTDTLQQLLEGDFLVVQGPQLTEIGLRGLGGPDEVVVAVAGGPAQSDLAPESFLVPMVTDLVTAGMPVLAGEPALGEEQEPPFVTVLRGEPAAGGLLATQDNVDHPAGQVGLVFALEDLLQGDPGHYGVKDGAIQPLPDLA